MKNAYLSENKLASRIRVIRGEQVILDFDLAFLYDIDNRRLKEAVRRNIDRFPKDFMFELTNEEHKILRSQIATSSWGGSRYKSYAFTEQGVAMLSGILNSKKAIEVNIAIMRTFVQLRKLMESNADLAKKINDLEKKYDERFSVVFDAIRSLISRKETPKKKIGF